MPTVDSLPSEIIDLIAEEVEKLLPSVLEDVGLLSTNEAVLEETLSVWTLSEAFVPVDASLARLATRVPRWHHQVTFDDEPAAFVRSSVYGTNPDDVSVEEFVNSPIASSIASGLAWVEKNSTDDVLVRLLIIPTHFIHALWLQDHESSKVLIVDRPKFTEELKMLHPYEEAEFFKLLRQIPYTKGVSLY